MEGKIVAGLEDREEVIKSEVIYIGDDNSHLDYKITDTYIIDIVHNYFCIFHAWLPTNDYERFLLKLIKYSMWSTLLLLLVFTFHREVNKLIGRFINFDFSVFWVLALASWLIQLICLAVGFLRLSPKKVDTIQNRMKSELNIDTSHLSNLNNTDYLVAKFEIEKLWFKKILSNGESIESLTEKVESNINNRKPSSRDINSIIQITLNNQYIINLLLVILTVTLTVSLSPLIPSITDENFFSMIGILNLSALYFWVVLVILFVFIKILFMTFIWSIENSTRNKMFVIWRYEIFKDMLARHQRATIKKPRIRYVPTLEKEKEQIKIEDESQNGNEIKIVVGDKVESKNKR